MSGIYLWIEDRRGKSSHTFWSVLMNQLYPDVIVESKKNNSELVKAVKSLEDSKNRYMIIFDNSFDNQQIYQERKILKKYIDRKENVWLIDIICFEYILLEFDRLLEWIYAPDDEFLIKRSRVIRAREKLVESFQSGEMDYKGIREIVEYDYNLGHHNVEQLSTRILFDLTRNTGFEVSKGVIGECWIMSCCDWSEREEDDICGLDGDRLSLYEKMKCIYHGTSLCRKLSDIGLEVWT